MSYTHNANDIVGTTILCIKRGEEAVIAGDGQVSLGNTVMKSSANKLRSIADGKIIAGFAGSTADAFTLFERLEKKLEKYSFQLLRSSVELAKDWRTDKYLRHLEAMLLVADKHNILLLSGRGDVIEPEHNVAAIGSGGLFALSAARALIGIKDSKMSTEEIARESMRIAADICVFSNHNIIVQKIK